MTARKAAGACRHRPYAKLVPLYHGQSWCSDCGALYTDGDWRLPRTRPSAVEWRTKAPLTTGVYLVTTPVGGVFTAWFDALGVTGWTDESDGAALNVLAWMPLPKPYAPQKPRGRKAGR